MKSPSFLRGGGDMGVLMRAMDWSQTPLGRTRDWPQSLRTTVSTCLNSRFPILIWWGPQFVKLYNDAYRPMLGAKHPRALGAPGREVWPEIWHIIGPMLESVVADGRATWSEDQLLPLERHGFSEECYFTFSYSPIHDESGGVGGVFCAVTETTGRVIGERRLRLLQEVAVNRAAATVEDACSRAMAVLARDPADDVPFALMYLLDAPRTMLRLVGATGIPTNAPIAPASVAVAEADDGAHAPWPFRRVLESGVMEVIDAQPGGSQRAFVIPVNASDGSATGVLVAGVSPHLPVDEQYRGFAALLARQIGGSIAQARALEDEKRRAEALAEIDRAKTAFFSNVSHEFRTPLTLMLSPTEAALASPERTLSGEDLATVHRNALRLLKLVNTLLDFARPEAGRARAVFEPTDLARLTADLASAFRSAMERAGLRFDVDCPPLSTPIHVDRDMWEKIVLNLLSNALKFTPRGRVAVSLRERDDHVELEVRDTGIGIPEHEVGQLFERFHRVQGSDARTHEGSGIGLALVRELVKMHGGTVTVASTVGEGSVFTVSVPAGVAHLPPESIGRTHAEPRTSVGARPFVEEALRWLPGAPAHDLAPATPLTHAAPRGASRILLADDNADMRRYVAGLLEDRWTVDGVADGRSALAAARANPPALVIADVMMPGLDGFELLRELRSDPRTSDVPVIVVSARAGEEARIEGLAAGADDYVVKPFSARELRARVEAQILRAEIRSVEAAHNRRLADIFRHAPLAIAILRGPEHVFEFVNDPYLALIAQRPVLGRAIREALPEREAQPVGDVLDRVYASGQPFTAESQLVRLPDGPSRESRDAFFTFVYQPIRGEHGDTDRVAVFAIEVTDLVTARREAEAANRAKDDFLAMLGHELRNPLAPILLAVKMLDLKGPDDPALQKLRDVIRRQATQMARLVDDLLDVGRIIAGKLVLEHERVEVNAMLAQAVETCTPLIQQRRHTLNVVLADRPVWVDGDGGRLVQVVCNLLNNAAKYMPEGGRIDLIASIEGGEAVIRVRDEGIGIAPEMLERIFERFVQVGSSRHRTDAGLGIGLSLVKAMVDLHGGSVTAKSGGIGKGSEFTVRLPAAAAAPPVPAGIGS